MAGERPQGFRPEVPQGIRTQKFSGFWIWKEEMNRHELWPRMSKAMASRHLENRNEREPVSTTQTPYRKSERRTFVPASLRTDKSDTEPL